MLPLVQMHQVVQSPHHLDPLNTFHGHLNPDYLPLHHQSRTPRYSAPYHGFNNPPQRAFPIRSSQPAQLGGHGAAPPFGHSHSSGHEEHQLRRKTPNGTIDAGYDGTPTQLATGPPPLKHMVLPGSSSLFPTAYSHRIGESDMGGPSQHHMPTGNWSFASQAMHNGAAPGMDTLGLSAQSMPGYPLGQDMSAHDAGTQLLHSIPHQLHHLNSARVPTALLPMNQPWSAPVLFSPSGYSHSAWPDAGLSDFRSPLPPMPMGFDNSYLQAQPALHQVARTRNALNQSQQVGLGTYPLNDGFHTQDNVHPSLQSPHRRLESLSLDPNRGSSSTSGQDARSPARFKERTLSHAHKTYAELLAYVSHARKAGKVLSGVSTKSKMVLFPKPTRQGSLNTSAQPLSNGFSDHSSMSSPAHLTRGMTNFSHPFTARGQHPSQQSPLGLSHPQKVHHLGVQTAFGHELHSPIANARASVEMLHSLCEQSGWKWVDGMLLGGCLHYGLEHYEKALEWFSRIINLDVSHVEAISNIAATLYCLNRQEEAEQHWVKAVKLRPSYLEAVEHLVGLLCSSQRSRQAVDTINFVQQALRLPSGSVDCPKTQSASETDESRSFSRGELATADGYLQNPEFIGTGKDNDTQAGFGSSGYAIPGSENGRMLLLVHAKGNMLYSLKDIERASEAFEEAVLISAGRRLRGIQGLIRRIQTVLSPREAYCMMPYTVSAKAPAGPLLLPPEKAKHTAQLVFASSNGQLPGLRHVSEGTHKRSAISTTSNSLLSLAKIFQDAMSNGGAPPGVVQQPAGVGDILSLYYLSLSLQESPSTANNVGILLASVQQTAAAQQMTAVDASTSPTVPGIIPGTGLALALSYYNYGLHLDPKHVHLHTNLGSLLKDIGQLDMAIQMYEQAVICDGTFDIALTNLANAVKDRGRIQDAIVYYRRAVASNPDFAEAVCGLSTALNSVCDWRGRGGVMLYNGKHDRWHVNDEGMLADVRQQGRGSGLMKRVVGIVARQLHESSRWGQGVLHRDAVTQLASQLVCANAGEEWMTRSRVEEELRKWAGNPWEGSRIIRLIERYTRTAMRQWYVDKYVTGKQSQTVYTRPRVPSGLTVPSAPTVLPFHTFTCPLTAKDIRMISQRNAIRISCSTLRAPWLSNVVYKPPPPPRPHLNIGYLSSDFNNHPLAHLMQSVFGFHDTSRAKAFCYATTPSDKSIHRQQIEQEAPVFRDVSSWSSDKVVDQIVQDDIHILVNLNGYTRGARNEIFAARPAPIQMSFMGFAGTLGAEWCDYILADTTAIPPDTLRPWRRSLYLDDVFRDEADNETDEWIYSENIIFCRDTFFCCDHAQSSDADERNVTWEDEQRRRWKMRKELFPTLPDDAIIMGNFNQLYKIDPTTFRTWLRILSNVPKAVLWLLRFPELGESNLKRTARLWAGEHVANRIIFTDVAPKQQHISRARVCDLFLDTPECNAHTTAADVLWSSTPLLTLPRYSYKMCSRMAASILKGALPRNAEGVQAAKELIASTDSEYEEFAIKLANSISYRMTQGGYGSGSGRLWELRKILYKSRWTCALFNTRRWVADLESAYEEAWRRWVAGEGGDIYL